MTARTSSPAAFDRLVDVGRRLPSPIRRVLRPVARAAQSRREPAKVVPVDRPTLDEIGLETGTDKSSRIHDYLNVYEQVLGHLRDEGFQLVEIGVHKGSSTRMWAQYFHRANVLGIDIDEACKEHADPPRIKIMIGNQSKSEFLARLAKQTDALVIIDDGSHVWKHQIDTFRALFPVLKPGGYFIVEDIHTSFGEDYIKTYGGSPETAYDYIAGIARSIVAATRAEAPRDDFETYARDQIESLVFLKHAIVVKKKPA